MVEHASSLARWPILQDIADGSDKPVGTEHSDVTQSLIFAIVNNFSKIVQQCGERGRFLITEIVASTNSCKLIEGNLWLGVGVGEDLIAGSGPAGTKKLR